MARVELRNVSKVYPGNITAVAEATLTIEDGELLVLVGPSGCGKSSILRMIAGLEEVTEGDIAIAGKRVNDLAARDRDIAMVFQNYALYPHMTVYRNMAFGLELRRYSSQEIRSRVEAAAQTLGLQQLLERKPGALSGGQRQRVALGRAIVRNPRVFLFDEPLSNLDARLRVEMRAELKRIHARLKTTMIYVTHDQVEAMTLGERIVVMRDGVIQQVARPLEMYRRPINAFVAGFVGSPPMNLILGGLFESNDTLYFRTSEGSLDLEVSPAHQAMLRSHHSRRLYFGIRAEDLVHLDSPRAQKGPSVEGRVESLEPVGSESLLNVSIGPHSLIARIPISVNPALGTLHRLGVRMKHAHFFDAETEQSILS